MTENRCASRSSINGAQCDFDHGHDGDHRNRLRGNGWSDPFTGPTETARQALVRVTAECAQMRTALEVCERFITTQEPPAGEVLGLVRAALGKLVDR